MLEENAPELYKMIPEDYWNAVEIGGKVYGVPTYKDSSLSEFFVWDQDIADKYEIDVEKVTDFESLYTAFKTIKEVCTVLGHEVRRSALTFLNCL